MANGNEGNRLLALVIALVFAIGFVIVFMKALFLPLIILTIFFFVLTFTFRSETLFKISIFLLIVTTVSGVIGFVFGGSEFGKFAQTSFFTLYNLTNNPIQTIIDVFP